MRKLLTLTVVLLAASSGAQEDNQPPNKYQAIFNGTDLAGWHGEATMDPRKLNAMSEEDRESFIAKHKAETDKHWTVKEGAIVNDGFGPYLTTDAAYGDFDFWIDYKTVAKADSGIYLRSTPQVQIWDYTDEKKFGIGGDKGSGGLWNNSKGAAGKDPLVLADKPFGEWNRFRIRQVGARTWVWLNGKLVVENAVMENYWGRSLPLIRRGPVQLQTHGGEIQWKNIFVREIGAQEANQILAQSNQEGFKSLFNGMDLEGWQGPVENYTVQDGAIVCKPGKGGTLHTVDEYADFVVRFEFKLPPGGNNGLALRYPGKGDTAYVGMCELQVLDSEHPKYARLDKRQYHGSAYGIAAAERGYLRGGGEWNFQEVTVKGSTIRVSLNGSDILNTDLSKASEFMGGRPHPGMKRTKGYFGFAGHSDPVQFRHVRIKELN